MKTFSIETFAAQRRQAQDKYTALLLGNVTAALESRDFDKVIAQVTKVFVESYHADTSEPLNKTALNNFVKAMEAALEQSTKDSDPQTTALMLSLGALNSSAIAAADADPQPLELEWVGMDDSKERPTHLAANGQTQAPGNEFTVGDTKMPYPGFTAAPIEEWINCRCVLRPTHPAEAQASTALLAALRSMESEGSIEISEELFTDAVERGLAVIVGQRDDGANLYDFTPDPLDELAAELADLPLSDDQADEVIDLHLALLADASPAPEPDESVTPDMPPIDAPAAPTDPLPDDANGIPVHGVLAPEGIPSGDGRGFKEGSLTHRPLPLPGTWQERTADGHDDAAVVFMIEKIAMIGTEQHFSGHLRTTEDADKFLGLMVDFGGRFGLSVDADSAVGEYDEATDTTWFSEARTSGAGSVNIPAFHEAYVAIGPHPILDSEDYEIPDDPTEMEPVADDAPALVAGGAFLAKAVQLFKDLAPGVTEDGPGWLTHPVDTDRLRDYWVRGEGAALISWGVPGDFNRCRANLAQYVKPEYLNGYCANRHYDALHVWPGQEANAERILSANHAEEGAAPSVSLVAAATGWCAPSEWFTDPKLDKPTGVVITEEGRTFGHIAVWGECHIGLPGACTAPPQSLSDYAYFKTGLVPTREGGFAEVGQLTIAGGHADQRLGYRGAVAHYDNTTSVWADVAVGEDVHGIWFSGSIRPNISEDMIYAARASGRLSGDWRDIHDNLELTGALSVNVPGFPIPKVSFAVQGGRQTALVAAGIVPLETETETSGPGASEILDDAALERFASKVFAMLEQRETIKTLTATLEKDE